MVDPLVEMVGVVAVLMTTPKALDGLVPHAFTAATATVPEVLPAVTVMLFVVELPDQPPGKLQEYEVAPLTLATLYVTDAPAHGAALPEIAPGCEGEVQLASVTVRVLVLT